MRFLERAARERRPARRERPSPWARAAGWVLAGAWGLGAASAHASSLAPVDFGARPIVGFGLGTTLGLSPVINVSLDWPVAPSAALGAVVGTSLAGAFGYEVRGMVRLVEGGREGPAIAGIAGVWGAPGREGFQLPGAVAPLIGFGMAYAVDPRWHLRLDLCYSPLYTYGREAWVFLGGPPGSGVEVGYRLSPGLEATLGINGRGDLLGLQYRF